MQSKARNIDPDSMVGAKQNKIADLGTYCGRKAMGLVATTSAIGMVMNGRLTGDGLMDRERNAPVKNNRTGRSVVLWV